MKQPRVISMAVPLHDDDDGSQQQEHTDNCLGRDLSEPLLVHVMDQEDMIDAQLAQQTKSIGYQCVLHGIGVGALVQLVHAAGSTYMALTWGPENTISMDEPNLIWHLFVYIATQVDLYLYVCMWLALTYILRPSGMAHVQTAYQWYAPVGGSAASGEEERVVPSARTVFLWGVQCYMGVVSGVFLTWSAMDLWLGLPVSLWPMVGVLAFGALVSKAMIWCYDMEDDAADQYEDEEYTRTFNGNILHV